ncbi:Dam family site-specific DNA-(adenine-N6)-methyltransferase [Campylobacter troglodytis]|uniref:Dam family site-specific DNA-(adenine-N6)-methyltransferase n=1 Tax=Campylobacter troglodytis TaxID=654363 RepID=UPI001159DF46|nr:Dam family site-specific DNA-(adenine-N6)-methyltransferase [Campylobacter troglodytis]TQR61290.1 DNA adenine methylase [Campylobacter troglodytis]
MVSNNYLTKNELLPRPINPSLFDELFDEPKIQPNKATHKPLRSPLFYVGDKYKLMPQLINLFPQEIHSYFEPFCGGGSSFLNVKARTYYLNDIDNKLILLHKFLQGKAQDKEHFFDELFAIIKQYKLSCSLLGINAPLSLRKAYKKTYFAKFNKDAYLKMREDFNADKQGIARLYLLLIYGFNRFLRFNARGDFNLPVGNVDFNANVFNALNGYFDFVKSRKIEFFNLDYAEFLANFEFNKDDFIYFDPPYLISDSEYNKLWSEDKEREFYAFLDALNLKGVCFGLSNLLTHKGRHNALLEHFARKYHCTNIVSNYISFNDNSIKKDSKELYVSNFKR